MVSEDDIHLDHSGASLIGLSLQLPQVPSHLADPNGIDARAVNHLLPCKYDAVGATNQPSLGFVNQQDRKEE